MGDGPARAVLERCGRYRPSSGDWYVALTGGGSTSASWGASGDVPLPLPYAIWKRFYGPA